MLIKYGLATKLRDHQIVTSVLIAVSIFVFLFVQKPDLLKIELDNISKRSVKQTQIEDTLYLEYCLSRVLDRKKCLFSKPFFQLKEIKKNIGKDYNLLLNDMGQDFKQSEHYLDFHQKLKLKKRSVIKLITYVDYTSHQKETLRLVSTAHKKLNIYSSFNSSITAMIVSVFSSSNLIHLGWNILLLLLFGRFVEKRTGRTQYLLGYFLGGIGLLHFYQMTLTHISFQNIIASSLSISLLIGFFLTSFHRFKLNLGCILKVSVCIPMIFFLQEIGLSFLTSKEIPHRAHFAAFVIGMIGALLWKLKYRLKPGFLFPIEDKEWNWLKDQADVQLFLNGATQMLEYNPGNFHIRKFALIRIKQEFEHEQNEQFFYSYIDTLLPLYLVDSFHVSKKETKVISLLKHLPKEMNLKKVLELFRTSEIKKLVNVAIKHKEHELCLRIIYAYAENNIRMKNYPQLNSQIDILCPQLNEEEIIHFCMIARQTKSIELRNCIEENMIKLRS